MNFMKGYKTVVFNVLALILAALALIGIQVSAEDAAALREGIDTIFAALAMIVPVVNVILRSITDSPVFKKTG